MRIEKIDKLIKENEEEIAVISERNGEYTMYTENALRERKHFLESVNSRLSSLKEQLVKIFAEIKALEENKNNEDTLEIDKQINFKLKKMNAIQNSFSKISKGRLKDVISSFIAQVDKRLYNKFYSNNKFGNFTWRIRCKIVSAFYKTFKSGSEPKLEKEMKYIQKGSYFENIKNSLFKNKLSKKIVSDVKTINLVGLNKTDLNRTNLAIEKDEDKKIDRVKELLGELSEVKLNDKSEANIQRLRDLLSWGEMLYNSLPQDAKDKIDEIRKILNNNKLETFKTESEILLQKRAKQRDKAIIAYMKLHPKVSKSQALKIADKYDAQGFTYERQFERWDSVLNKKNDVEVNANRIQSHSDSKLNSEVKLFIARVNALTISDLEAAREIACEYKKLSDEAKNSIPKETYKKLVSILSVNKKTTRQRKEKRIPLNAVLGNDNQEYIPSAYGDVGPYNPYTIDHYWENEGLTGKKR